MKTVKELKRIGLDDDQIAIVRDCQHRKSDMYGTSGERVWGGINSRCGSPICEVAMLQNVIEVIQILTK